jgi:protein MYSM1
LESIGAINVNCTTNAPRPKRPAMSRVEYYSDEDDTNIGQVADWLMEYEGYVYINAMYNDMFARLTLTSNRPRKRKVRDEKGHWVDPKDLEGRVIEHGVEIGDGKSDLLRKIISSVVLTNKR